MKCIPTEHTYLKQSPPSGLPHPANITYQMPKVDACYFPDGEEGIIELACCFMWRDRNEEPSLWNVGAAITRWDNSDFPGAPLA